jgi:hypothetical protein
MIEGTTVKIGRKEYILPPLNLGGIQKIISYIPTLTPSAGVEFLVALTAIACCALQRNYPDEINEQFLRENVEDDEVEPLLEAINQQVFSRGIFGKKLKAAAANLSTPSTGTESTLS